MRKTKKRVYVERDSRSWRENERTYHDVRTVVLDRATLERDGDAYCRAERESYYTQPYAEAPACSQAFRILGLGAKCTKEDVARAYRNRAMQLHPDHGGDAENSSGFIRRMKRRLDC